MQDSGTQERVCVTLTVEEWAKIIASVGMSRLELEEKEHLNSVIYDCVSKHERVLR